MAVLRAVLVFGGAVALVTCYEQFKDTSPIKARIWGQRENVAEPTPPLIDHSGSKLPLYIGSSSKPQKVPRPGTYPHEVPKDEETTVTQQGSFQKPVTQNIIVVPDLNGKCPDGYAFDPSGECREIW